MNCPDCHHPVHEHAEFYCLHVGCRCNLPNVAAEARARCYMLDRQLGVAKTNLEDMKNNEADYSVTDFMDIARHTLEYIASIARVEQEEKNG